MTDLQVEPEAGLCGEAALAGPTGQLSLLQMDPTVVLKLGGDTEGLSTIGAAVAARLGVDASVVFEGQEIGIRFEAHGAMINADGVGVLVV